MELLLLRAWLVSPRRSPNPAASTPRQSPSSALSALPALSHSRPPPTTMAAARPLCRLLLQPPARRALSTTPPRSHRGPLRDHPVPHIPITPATAPYTPADLAELRKRYSAAQIASFLAGERAISRSDFESRVARPRGDAMGLRYLDDLSMYDPVLDFPDPAHPPEYVIGHPLQPLPVLSDPTPGNDEDDKDAAGVPWMRSVSRKTGFSEEQLSRFRTRVLVSHRVVNMTHMGKISKIYSLVVAGNGNGLVGIGEGKATEFEDSHRMATYVAMRNLEPIPRYEGRTIFGDVEVKVGAVELGLYSRPPGRFASGVCVCVCLFVC